MFFDVSVPTASSSTIAAFVLVLYAHRQGVTLPSWLSQGSFGAAKKSAGQKSGVRTAFLEMVLDHDSGAKHFRAA